MQERKEKPVKPTKLVVHDGPKWHIYYHCRLCKALVGKNDKRDEICQTCRTVQDWGKIDGR